MTSDYPKSLHQAALICRAPLGHRHCIESLLANERPCSAKVPLRLGIIVNLADLLKRGYFPKELPPPFTTEAFGELLERDPSQLSPLSDGNAETLLARHSLARAGPLRRILSIPNPLSFLQLCNWFNQNWLTVENQCQKSSISLSKPQASSSDRAVVSKVPFNQQPIHQAALRATSRCILRTDITNCYPSIYTHSISWALHTKSEAKIHRRPSDLTGNQLDKLVTAAQHGQTIGIPIGPDTSFIIAEMILSSVDEEFARRLEKEKLNPNGYRAYDDFEFGFTTRADAESAAGILERVLSEYELQLSPSKTNIVELPVPLESAWVSELRTFNFSHRISTWEMRRYFDRAFELSMVNGSSEVLKYAIQRLRSIEITGDDWTLFEDLLLQCAMVEPSVLPIVVDHLHYYRDKNYPLNSQKIGEVFNILLKSHAPLGHGSEVAWSLWGCLLFQLRISRASVAAVASMEDAIAGLLLLHAQELGLLDAKIECGNWNTSMTEDGLRGSQWLLSYQANINGWGATKDDYVSRDRQFGLLKARGVSFYDAKKVRDHAPGDHYHAPFGSGGGVGY